MERLNVTVADSQYFVNATIPTSVVLRELTCENTLRRGKQAFCCWLVYLEEYTLKIFKNEIRIVIDSITKEKDFHELVQQAKELPNLMVDEMVKQLLSRIRTYDQEISLSQAMRELEAASSDVSMVENNEQERIYSDTSPTLDERQRLPVCRNYCSSVGMPQLHLRTISLRQLIIPAAEASILENVPDESLSSTFGENSHGCHQSNSIQSSSQQNSGSCSNSAYSHPTLDIEAVSNSEQMEVSDDRDIPTADASSRIEAIGSLWNKASEDQLISEDESISGKSVTGTQASDMYMTAPESLAITDESRCSLSNPFPISEAFRVLKSVPQSTQISFREKENRSPTMNEKQRIFSRWYPRNQMNDRDFQSIKNTVLSWMNKT